MRCVLEMNENGNNVVDQATKLDVQQSENKIHCKRSERQQLSNYLDRCLLRCRNGRCSFVCSGENVRRFVKHARICKYQLIACPNKGCVASPTKCTFNKHLENCKMSAVVCNFSNCGKRIFLTVLDTHLKECEHRPIKCDYCAIVFPKREYDRHTQVCLKTIVECPNNGCGMKMTRYHFPQHENYCQYKVVKCPHKGCLVKDMTMYINTHAEHCHFKLAQCEVCGLVTTVKDFEMHSNECDSCYECVRCRQMVRISSMRTHDKYVCQRRNYKLVCTICHQLYDFFDSTAHKNHDIWNPSIYPITDEQQNKNLASTTCCLPDENEEPELKERKSTGQEESIDNRSELIQNIQILSIDGDFSNGNRVDGCFEETNSRNMWYGGRYAKGRRKFERLLSAIEGNHYHVYTSTVKEAYNFGCKKYDMDFNFVAQFK